MKSKMRVAVAALAAGVLLGAPAPADAQVRPSRGELSPYAGVLSHDEVRSYVLHPIVGLRAVPYRTGPVGLGLDFAWWPDYLHLGPTLRDQVVRLDYLTSHVGVDIGGPRIGAASEFLLHLGAGGQLLRFGERFEAAGLLPRHSLSPSGAAGIGLKLAAFGAERSLMLRFDARARIAYPEVFDPVGIESGRELTYSPELTLGLSYVFRDAAPPSAPPVVVGPTPPPGGGSRLRTVPVVASEPAGIELSGPAAAPAGRIAGPFTVTVRERTGGVTRVPVETVFALAARPSDGIGFYADAAASEPLRQLRLAPGDSSASFYVRETAIGAYEVRVDWLTGGDELDGASREVAVSAAEPTRLAFVRQPSDLGVGDALDTIVVEVRDRFGNLVRDDPDPAVTEAIAVGVSPAGTGARLTGERTRPVDWTTARAVFENLSIDRAGRYRLTAAPAAGLDDASPTGSTAFTATAPVTACIVGHAATRLDEAELDGALLVVELGSGAFRSGIGPADVELTGAPAGVSVRDVEWIAPTRVRLRLGFDGTDFDMDTSIGVRVSASALEGGAGPVSTHDCPAAAGEAGANRPETAVDVAAPARRGMAARRPYELYTIQAGAYDDRQSADARAERLRAHGVPVAVLAATVEGRRLYRVRVGAAESWAGVRALERWATGLLDAPVWVTRIADPSLWPEDAVERTAAFLAGG